MTRIKGESTADWLLRADRELAAAQEGIEREDQRIGFEDVLPGSPLLVLDDRHGVAADTLEAAEQEQQNAQRAWLSEQ